jgi:thiamine-monophosphate kinase
MAAGEFSLINTYFKTPHTRQDVTIGVGDDCAVVSIPEGKQLAVTVDTLVSGIHFPSDTSPADIACKAIAVNLSDLAAIGARPAWLTLALTLPEGDESWVRSFADSFHATADRYEVQLIGGDTTQGPLSITVQALGLVDPEHVMRRGGARPGDAIYVSGTLGDAAAGLKILQQEQLDDENQAWLVNRLNRPQARVELGNRASAFCRCAIDISDGLAADLGHILEASDCGATVNVDRIPLSHQLVEYSNNRNEVDWNRVLSGGDDYELCLVVAPENDNRLMQLAGELSLPLTRIGTIEARGALNFIDASGATYLLNDNGYEHFTE